ncbi:3beta-hydroxysteroid-dehydrogenase/decarboxylase isoform X1 [Lolium perenne]|uniref:3beta-hydroxysteroid-dehydrogenase/decarboxylase isoform X1 n=1 Tax=Lolium perenne TaxID=4522 RepID=UPI0021F62349|nr:3beta-hydroxysteroid-dehydrogenase/decarboxylase-like isoform X1 [Lolium perenne]
MELPAGDRGLDGLRWCVVTGGRGFMARHLVAALLRSGDWRVRITDLAPVATLEPDEEGLLGAALRVGLAEYVSADVCDLAQLTKAFEGVDVVFHTATADPAKNCMHLHYKVNVDGAKNVIGACKTCKVKSLIYTSSSSVVFDGIHDLFGVDESVQYPAKFPDAYAQTKAEAEKLVMEANGMNGLLSCCLRPGSIFGPGDMVISSIISYGGKLIIIGEGKNSDDFVYVDNVVHGHICAMKALSTKVGAKLCGGQAYFITNVEPMNVWDFVYMVLEELGYKRPLKIRIPLFIVLPITYVIEWSYNKVLYLYGMHQPQSLTSARIKYLTLSRTFSCNRAIEQLGYKPIVSLKDGVKATIEMYNRPTYARLP